MLGCSPNLQQDGWAMSKWLVLFFLKMDMNKQTYFRKMLRTKKLLSMLESWLTENEKDELRDLLK